MGKKTYRPLTKPFPWQKVGTIKAVKHRNFALFMEPRTGKSKTALDAVGIHHLRGQARRVLVLTTLDGVAVWEDEVRKHFPYPALVTNMDGGRYLVHGKRPRVQFHIMNHDKFSIRRRSKSDDWVYPWAKAVERWGPDVVIVDESHAYASAGSVRGQQLWRSVRRMRDAREGDGLGQPWVLLLTGTPTPRGWLSIFSQFRIMDEEIFGTAKADFEDMYVVYGRGPKMQFKVMRYKHEPSIKKRVRAHSYQVARDNCPGLEHQTFWNELRIELPTKAREIYDTLAEDFLVELENGLVVDAKNAAALRIRLLQVTGGFTTDGTRIHQQKLGMAEAWAGSLFNQNEQCVVYCRFLPEVAAVTRLLQDVGFDAHSIHGGVKRQHRKALIAGFQRTRRRGSPRAIVFQVSTGSMAIDLSAGHEVLYYSLPDGWAQFYQSYSRFLGPAQREAVRYSAILARETADLSVFHNLRGRRDVHRELMRNPRGWLFGHDTMNGKGG